MELHNVWDDRIFLALLFGGLALFVVVHKEKADTLVKRLAPLDDPFLFVQNRLVVLLHNVLEVRAQHHREPDNLQIPDLRVFHHAHLVRKKIDLPHDVPLGADVQRVLLHRTRVLERKKPLVKSCHVSVAEGLHLVSDNPLPVQRHLLRLLDEARIILPPTALLWVAHVLDALDRVHSRGREQRNHPEKRNLVLLVLALVVHGEEPDKHLEERRLPVLLYVILLVVMILGREEPLERIRSRLLLSGHRRRVDLHHDPLHALPVRRVLDLGVRRRDDALPRHGAGIHRPHDLRQLLPGQPNRRLLRDLAERHPRDRGVPELLLAVQVLLGHKVRFLQDTGGPGVRNAAAWHERVEVYV